MNADVFSRCEKFKSAKIRAIRVEKKTLRSNKIHLRRTNLDAEIYFRHRFKQDSADERRFFFRVAKN